MNPVLICIGDSIMETGVTNLVNSASDLRAVSIPDNATIKRDIHTMQPCVVILDGDAAGAKSAQVLDLLDTLPQLRILMVHLESNMVQIYDKREITLREAADLIEHIHQSWPVTSGRQD